MRKNCGLLLVLLIVLISGFVLAQGEAMVGWKDL